MSANFTYDVFLSHNSKDKAAVEQIATALVTSGLNPFLDKWNLVPGDPWQAEIEAALRASHSCAVFLGPSGMGGWHNEEMAAALDRAVAESKSLEKSQRFRVIPVLLPGATQPQENQVPVFLANRTWVDFRSGLDNSDTLNRLVKGIQGLPPGPPIR
jgi:hypothetical protein